MLQVRASDESESSWSIQEQLLLAQAVHQVQADASAVRTIDWAKVTELLEQFLTSNKIEGLHFSYKDQTVCSDVYAKLCQTFLKDQSQGSLDGSQTFTVARQIYGIYIQSIAQALQEEEKKCEKIRSEIDAIARGEWDEKLKAEEAESLQKLQTFSEQPEPSNSQSLRVEQLDPSESPTLTKGSVPTSVPPGTTNGKSPDLTEQRPVETPKEVQQEKTSTNKKSPTNVKQETRANVKQETRGRKRKVPYLNISDTSKKIERPSTEDLKKQSVKGSTSRSRGPQVPNGPGSDNDDDDDDDDATVEQLIKGEHASLTETTKKSKNSKNEREQPDPSDSKRDSSQCNMPQSKRARLSTKEDVLPQRDAESSAKSPASGHSPSPKGEGGVIQEKWEHGRDEKTDSPSSKKLPTAKEAPVDGNIRSGKMTDESHSTTHSPNSTKKSTFENEVSFDGSLAGTPNSATFGLSTTEANVMASQTPNSAKLGLYPTTTTDTSSLTSAKLAGSSSTNNTGTTNDPTSFRRRMLKTHSSVQSNPISSIFRDPVKESEAPGYYSIIKRPMDLRTLAKKLRDGKVISTEEYRRDLMLMLANAVMFNHEDSEVARYAKELMIECDRLVSIFVRGSRY